MGIVSKAVGAAALAAIAIGALAYVQGAMTLDACKTLLLVATAAWFAAAGVAYAAQGQPDADRG